MVKTIAAFAVDLNSDPNTHKVTYNLFVASVPGDRTPFWLLWTLSVHIVNIYTWRQNKNILKFRKTDFLIVKHTQFLWELRK